MEPEQDETLIFLDIFIKTRTDGSLGHNIYSKRTRTNLSN